MKTLNKKREKLTNELHDLMKELRKKYPHYVSLHYPIPVPPENLPLKDNETLLEYAVTDEATYLFVAEKDKASCQNF